MKAKSLCLFVFVFSLPFATWSFGFEDCFNYQCVRQDMKEHEFGWGKLKAFESNKDNFILDKRWPTVNLKLTPEGERVRFGTTGLEVVKRTYLLKHFDGTNMRMLVFIRILRAAGERKVIGWRVEKNPPMPKEYLDPTCPEEEKKGMDWKLMIHVVYPPDIRGFGTLIYSYNNKAKDNDTWVWFPSLRKVRRVTPANGDDYFVGSYLTYSQGFLRRITDEVHQIIGETKAYGYGGFIGYFGLFHAAQKYGLLTPEYMRFCNSLLQPREYWVIRSVSVKGGYCDYYHTRIWLSDKEWGHGPVIEEIYKKGRLVSTHFWAWRRQSGYDGKVAQLWSPFLEDINFEERGFSWYGAAQYNLGYDNPDEWFTLRELKKSIPTVNIPYMAVLPPKKLLPIEVLFPSKELQEAYKRHSPKRYTSFPNADAPLFIEGW